MDFKKSEKELYSPKVSPSIVDVPEFVFIAVDGNGDPNTSKEYQRAIEILYGLSYAIKMGNKSILEYVVAPLEGFWSYGKAYSVHNLFDKSEFSWTSVIRQPEFVAEEIFLTAKAAVAKKKPALDLTKARLVKVKEGLCVQAIHTGPFDSEPETIEMMDRYATENGYVIDLNEKRRHHEIYLSDFRKTSPENLKTIIRHPVRRA